MIQAGQFKPIFALTSFFWVYIANVNGAVGFDWELHQKIRTIETSLMQTENWSKFVNISSDDNRFFENDTIKARRTYENVRCIAHLSSIHRNFNKWTFSLFDVWGKLPTGDYTADFGGFDECRNFLPTRIDESMEIRSQYCVIDIRVRRNERAVKTKSTFLRIGICIPDSCAPSLVEEILNEYLNATNTVTLNISPGTCQLADDNTELFTLDKIVIIFIISIISLVIWSTIYDVKCTRERKENNPLLTAFSALRNGKRLFTCKSNPSPDFINCFHGIRAIASQWIILHHIHTFTYYSNLNNFECIKFAKSFGYIVDGGARLSVDSFLLLSGVLASFTILKQSSKINQKLKLRSLYFRRLLRIVPVFVFVALFQLTLFKFSASGPNYNQIDAQRNQCEKYLWQSLFFISNYVTRTACVLPSWYFSVDMQLFIIAPFLVVSMKRNSKRFVFFSIVAISIHAMAILADVRPSGWKMEEYYYFPTHNRFTSWLIGLMFGYFLHKTRSRKICVPKHWNILTLVVSLLTMAFAIQSGKYFKVTGMYLLQTRLVWSLALCYIIFSCVNYDGVVNWILSHPYWQPFSRLNLISFLIHPMVMTAIVVNARNGQYFSKLALFQLYLVVTGVTFLIATILALTIEMPIAALEQKYSSGRRQTIK